MAERAAHTTTSVQTKPSIFELIAQESLAETVYPAFKRIVQFLVSRNPELWGWLGNWCDESYLVLNSFIQYYYMKNRSASFAETFYGLERVSVLKDDLHKLNSRQKFWSLMWLTIFPYLMTKFEQLAEKYRYEEAYESETLFALPKSYKVGVIKCNSTLNFLFGTANLAQYLLYMTGRSHYHKILFRLIKVSLVYYDDEDQLSLRDLWSCAWRGRTKIPDFSSQLVLKTLSAGFEAGAFFLQCLNWYNLQSVERKQQILPLPKPPPQISRGLRPDLCPICQNRRRIPTALATSGEVFCFKCIKPVLDNDKKCPVTGLPSTVNDLIRIYHH
ncbi:hypothetical protein LSTR_LSTR014785 [Laodelphax striatellus]|uniref:Peroxisome assembly protein 12 n=1 Tax=Laodelphax striatellus TaxID=195883 RepID=A0A482WXR0_LAOST|nr:hypothetical protein LSTR_LSTR014785 [Laodelphax striatellus]